MCSSLYYYGGINRNQVNLEFEEVNEQFCGVMIGGRNKNPSPLMACTLYSHCWTCEYGHKIVDAKWLIYKTTLFIQHSKHGTQTHEI